MRRRWLILSFIVIFAGKIGLAQTQAKKNRSFKPSEYPKGEFLVTASTHTIGSMKIRIIHVKRRKQSETPPSFCRAWVEVARDERLVRRIYYDDFEPVGSKFGVFVPLKQPSPEFFSMVKEGDYDGHLLLVDSAGHVTDTLGGAFFVANGTFLVSAYYSDEPGLAVFDLANHKLILKTTDIPYIQGWYKDEKSYFFTESEWSGNSGEPHEKAGVAYRLDLDHGKVVKVDMNASKLHSAVPVKYDFDPRKFEDCTSR